jgi:hypothetical protein
MGGAQEFLEDLKRQGTAAGHFRGLLHVLIGRRVEKADGTVLSAGVTWRDLAALLKKVRWDKEAVRELGLDPNTLPPRDRERYWFVAIGRAQVDAEATVRAGDRLAAVLLPAYVISAAPTKSPSS